MDPALPTLDLSRIAVNDRIALVQVIGDSIAKDSPGPLLTDVQRQEIRRRLVDCRDNPNDVIPWEQIKAEARKRFQA